MRIHAHLSQWLHTLGSSGFRLHAPVVKPRTNSRVSRASDNPILHFKRGVQVRKIITQIDESAHLGLSIRTYVICP